MSCSSLQASSAKACSCYARVASRNANVLQVEFHRYLLQTQMARCPKDKKGLSKKLWRTKRFLQFCAGRTC